MPCRRKLTILLILSCWFTTSHALAAKVSASTRSKFLKKAFEAIAAASLVDRPMPCLATAQDNTGVLGLSDKELKDIIISDVVNRQFLVTGNLTPTVYRSTATFTDEIDTYAMNQWIKGTQKLFVGKKSNVRLVGDVEVTPRAVEFRFDEDLCFNIPFQPVVALSGKVVLERDAGGYITSYREFWDQDVASVLKTVKFK